mgnify:CR=1 FL=1
MEEETYDLLILQFISMVSKDRAKILALEHEVAALKSEIKRRQELDQTVIIKRPAGAYRIGELE